MTLNSIQFLIFMAAVTALYYLLPHKARNVLLLAASLVFYTLAAGAYVFAVAGITVASYGLMAWLDSRATQKGRRAVLAVSVAVYMGMLFACKYINFFGELAAKAAALFGGGFTWAALPLLLPLGVSFFLFNLTGYAADLCNGRVEREKSFLIHALFVCFFPHVTSGPIARAGALMPQFRERHSLSYSRAVAALTRFLTGAFKKVVIADGLSIFVNAVFADVRAHSGYTLICGVLFYTVQIYCDFSGYSDMALGTAQLLGFRLAENFSAPYLSASLGEFWGRWHMSLMGWFRDYIYIPLGGNRKGFFRKLVNIAVVFLFSGLWHGANTTFLVWGAWLAAFRILEELLSGGKKPRRRGLGRLLGWLYTNAVVVTGWVFFRADSLSDAIYVLQNMFRGLDPQQTLALFKMLLADIVPDSRPFLVVFAGMMAVALLVSAYFDRRTYGTNRLAPTQVPLASVARLPRWLLYWFMLLSTAWFWVIAQGSSTVGSFIYNNF